MLVSQLHPIVEKTTSQCCYIHWQSYPAPLIPERHKAKRPVDLLFSPLVTSGSCLVIQTFTKQATGFAVLGVLWDVGSQKNINFL